MGMRSTSWSGGCCGGISLSVPPNHPVSFGGEGEIHALQERGELFLAIYCQWGDLSPLPMVLGWPGVVGRTPSDLGKE